MRGEYVICPKCGVLYARLIEKTKATVEAIDSPGDAMAAIARNSLPGGTG